MIPVRLCAALAMLALPLVVSAQQKVSPPTIGIRAQTAGAFKTSDTFGDLNSDYSLLGNPDRLEHAEASLLNFGAPGSPVVPFLFSDSEASGTSSGANADANIIYQIQAQGPLNVPVPIVVHVSGISTTVSLSGGGASSVVGATDYMTISNIDNVNNNAFRFDASYTAHAVQQFGSALDTANNFVTDTHLLSAANVDLVTITMEANTTTSSFFNYSGKANAQIDPYIYIDPSFPDAALYTLVVSPGVSNDPAPEPATLLLLGMGGALFLGRRQSRA